MKELISMLSSIWPLSEELQNHLATILQIQDLKKKEVLLEAGQICRNIYFVERGLFRCYYVEDGKETCSWFMKEGDVIASVGSFYSQQRGYEWIQAIEKSRVYFITHAQLQFVYHNFIEFNFTGRVLTEKYYQLCDQRAYILRKQKAVERYAFLLEHHGELVNRVPRGYLATYLGIRQETLSRIMGKM